MKRVFKIIIEFPILLFLGIYKSLLLTGINLKKSFSMKECKLFVKTKLKNKGLHRKNKKIVIILIFPLSILAGLITTIIMIPLNIFFYIKCCIEEDY